MPLALHVVYSCTIESIFSRFCTAQDIRLFSRTNHQWNSGSEQLYQHFYDVIPGQATSWRPHHSIASPQPNLFTFLLSGRHTDRLYPKAIRLVNDSYPLHHPPPLPFDFARCQALQIPYTLLQMRITSWSISSLQSRPVTHEHSMCTLLI